MGGGDAKLWIGLLWCLSSFGDSVVILMFAALMLTGVAANRCPLAVAKESSDWLQNCRRVAGCGVYGLVGLSPLKDMPMSCF